MCIKEDLMNEYKWRGHTYRIADEDLKNYPGAEPIKKKQPEAPKNKKRTVKNKKATEDKEA